jgi:hypothetical protein
MAYGMEPLVAARRHLRAAVELHQVASAGAQPGCRAIAGYLFGLCGELALKATMIDSGMRPGQVAERRDDPFFAHFPELKDRLLDTAYGRREGELRRFAEDASLFQNWHTKMRYAPTSDIKEAWVAAWRASAEALIVTMESL